MNQITRFLMGVLTLAAGVATASEEMRGSCQYTSSAPGIPVATCQIPACPTGGDCAPPTVEKRSAQVRFDEPLYRWTDHCPDETGNASCWEVQFASAIELAAADSSGIRAVGVNVAIETGSQRQFKKFWVENPQLISGGRYTGNFNVRANVPPGRTLSLSVYELCARDGRGNTHCVFPLD